MTVVQPFPSRFRLRLVSAFVLVAGVSCGALAVSTWLVARHSRRQSFVFRAEREVDIHTALVPHPVTDQVAAHAAGIFDRAGGEDVVIVTADGSSWGSSGLTLSDLGANAKEPVRTAPAGAATASVRGRSTLVVWRTVEGARWYFLFDESDLKAGIHELAVILLVGWLVVVGAAAIVGRGMARATLRPVRAASDAARALAEGLLDTRLPVGPDDEFGRWARYFNDMAAALEGKIEDLSNAHERERRFTANVAHELRTPLAAAVNATALLEARLADAPDSLRRPAELVIADVHRLRHLAQELLELARLDSHQEAVAAEVVSLPAVAEAARRNGGWTEVIGIEASPVWVIADRRRLERVLTNLFANAMEHGAPPVEVTVSADGASGVVDVHDAGPGISATEQDEVFQRFHKGDGSRSGPGAGLGLAIALEHARAMNGTLRVRSGDGQGTTFRLQLPLAHGAPSSRMLGAATERTSAP